MTLNAGAVEDNEGSAERKTLADLNIELGTKIGRYVLLEQIGRGGMSVIWAAYDPQLDRKIALKLLLVVGNEASRTRLLREAQALGKLAHPNVVTLHDVGVHEEQVWIAMEFIDGQTLRAWMRAKPRTWQEVRAVMLEAGRGLAAAHDKGLVHRDFKPDNVMLDSEGRVRVLDFGLVRSEDGPSSSVEDEEDASETDAGDLDLDELGDLGDPEESLHGTLQMRDAQGSASLPGIPIEIDEDEDISKPLDTDITRGGAVMGTPAYMAPEQHLCVPTDARADQFGFCVTLWEALYGQRPFSGTTLATLASSVCEGRIKEPPRGTEVPAWMRKIAERGLAARRDDRYTDMYALLEALSHESRGRWKLVTALVGGLTLAGVVTGYTALSERRTLAACEAEGAAIHEVWSEDAQAEVAAAFAGTKLDSAADSWSRTQALIDGWTTQWASLREASCVETQLHQSRSEEALERSRSCFDRHQAGLVELVGVLAEVDELTIHSAVLSAAGLPTLASCTDASRAQVETPEDPNVSAQVRELNRALQRADALLALGRYEDSLRASEAVRTKAKAIAWTAVEAEAELALGRGHILAGGYEQAELSLERAFILAGKANRDEVMALAGLALTRVVGDLQARYEEGLRWARLAELYFERAGLLGTPDHAKLEITRGRVQQLNGDYDEALRSFEQALEHLDATLGPTHPRVASLLNNLGNYYQIRGEYTQALERFDRAEAIYEATLGPDHPKIAVIFNNKGNAYNKLGTNNDAIVAYERALEIRLAAFGPEHPDVGTALSNLGNAYITARRLDEALSVTTQALAIREAALGSAHPRVGTTLNNLGEIHRQRGELETALGYFERALANAKQALGPTHARVGTPLSSIGAVRFELGDLEGAYAAYTQSLELETASFGPEHATIADTSRALAAVERERGNHAEAKLLLDRARTLMVANFGPESMHVAAIELDLGELAQARGHEVLARVHDERGLELLEKWQDPQPGELARARWALAQLLHDDRARGRSLAKQARAEYAQIGQQRLVAEIDAWLATR